MNRTLQQTMAIATLCAVLCAYPARAAMPAPRWSDVRLTPERRAELLLAAMTPEEKLSLVHGRFPLLMSPRLPGVQVSAGWFAGLPRLGVPPIAESDASLGVANARRGPKDDATALPSGLALAATFDADIAFASGAMIGKEARQKGFNVLLAGGANLVRDPRNGRNFEYLGEDPLLTGVMAGASIRGIQSNGIVSTTKHLALNAQETGRQVLDAVIDPAALRESDLLAFQIAVERGRPGAIMCSYNRLNGAYACENPDLLAIPKREWGWRGWMMSDWGAVHSVRAANAGLDQESGQELDKTVFFDAPLKAELASGAVTPARLDDMVRRVLWGLFSTGAMDHPVQPGGSRHGRRRRGRSAGRRSGDRAPKERRRPAAARGRRGAQPGGDRRPRRRGRALWRRLRTGRADRFHDFPSAEGRAELGAAGRYITRLHRSPPCGLGAAKCASTRGPTSPPRPPRGALCRRGGGLRHAMDHGGAGRLLVAARRAGRPDRSSGRRQLAHGRGAGDWRTRADALARQGRGGGWKLGTPAHAAARRSRACSPARWTRRAAYPSAFPARSPSCRGPCSTA